MPSENYVHSEVKEIMVTKPGWVLRHGNKIILSLLASLMVFAAFFSYPETIATGVELVSLSDSETVRAPAGNRGIHLFLVKDHQPVEPGTPLLVWEDGAGSDYALLLELERQLQALGKTAGTDAENLPASFRQLDARRLGSLRPLYQALCQQGPTPALLAKTRQAVSSWKERHLVTSKVRGVARVNYILPRTGIPVAAEYPVLYLEQEATEFVGIGQIGSEQFSRVQPGQQVIVQLHELGQENILGEVVQVAPLAENLRHQVVFKVSSTKRAVNASYTGTARILVENKSLLNKMLAY